MLSIEVLGRFRLVVDGAAVELRGAQRRRVAALLSAHAPDPVGVSVLTECLDPGASSANPANAVQAHIRRLRTAIEPGVPGSRSTRLPVVGDGYALIPARLDLWDLRAAVADAPACRDVDPSAAERLLASALDRWGTPWGSLGEDEVLLDQRWSLDAERLALEDEWCALAVLAGVGTEACERLVALARAEPIREHRTAHAMQALFRLGRQAEALRLFDAVRDQLRDALGVSPGPQLSDMYLRVLRQDPGLRTRRVRVLGLPPRVRTDPVVGREDLVQQLDALVARHRVVTVAGPSGVGTTRLVEHWVTSGGEHDAAIWIDVRDAVDGIDAALGDALGVGASAETTERGAAARRVLPHGATVVVLDGAEHRPDEVATAALELLAARAGLHVVVTSTGALDLPGEQVLVVPPLGLVDGPDASIEPAVELAADRLGPAASTDDARRAARHAAGLPLAIELEAGASFGLPGAPSTGRPASLDEVVRAAVLRVSPAARHVLARASALPDGVGIDDTEWHCGRRRDPAVIDPHEHRRLLGELVRAQLVEVRDGGTGVRYVARPQVAPVVGADPDAVDPIAGRSIAGEHLDWIRHVAGRDAALVPLVPDATRRALLRAEPRNVSLALATLRAADPIEHLEVVLALVPHLGRLPERWRVRAEIEHSRALDPSPLDDARLVLADVAMVPDLAGVATRAADSRVALERLDAHGAEPEWIVGARVVNAIAAGWSGDLAGAGAHLTAARDLVPELRSPWTVAVLDRYVSVFHLASGEPAEGLALAVDAAERLVDAGDPIEALGALHFAITSSWAVPGADTAALLERAEQLVGTSGSVFEPLLRAERARHALAVGAPDRAELLAAAATSLDAGGLLRTAAVTRRRLGLLHLAEGRREPALEQLLRAAAALLDLDPAAGSLAVAGLAALVADDPRVAPSGTGEQLGALALALRTERGSPLTGAEAAELEQLVSGRGAVATDLADGLDPVARAAALVEAIRL